MAIDWGSLVIDATGAPTLMDSLKAFLGIDAGDNTQDAALDRALNAGGPAVETFVDRVIAQRSVTQHFPHHFGTVVLKHSPVVGDVTVTLNGEAYSDYSTYVGMGGDVYLTRIGHARDVPMDWRYFDQVDVTYTAGFDPLPADVALGLVYTSGGLFQSDGTGLVPSDAEDVTRMTIADVGSISYGGGDGAAGFGVVPPTARELLFPYRRMSA